MSTAPAASVATTASTPRLQQRLVVCLDGTWNNRDDCTNVYHLANLCADGDVTDVNGRTVRQRVRYFEGVGTGPLDKLSGGGFGFGLEKNVRLAYDWLVEVFADDGGGVDEIFVFGFSRGAFTARSLVGFIAQCGLLRHGAPLTVNQLWDGYCRIGREREDREGWWERVAGRLPLPFRRLSELVTDPWEGGRERSAPRNRTEALLAQWSRRVRIRYLGVFDTVGAIGWDALAIPGLRSRLALQHNMRPTTLVQSCRHALAIDEHRQSFQHTPFVEFAGGTGEPWDGKHAAWQRAFCQRWFAGAHANIGGGYPDNELAMLPLRWIVEGARAAGLEVALPPPPAPPAAAAIRDSYAEFIAPLWSHVLRGKRHHRRIDPPPEVRAYRKPQADGARCFRLVNIGEEVDASVLELAGREPGYSPPNLLDWARRAAPDGKQALAELAARPCPHIWAGGGLGAQAATVGWATLAAIGWDTARGLFGLPGSWSWFAAPLAVVFAAVDWAESRAVHALACGRQTPVRRAAADVLYWLRATGVLLFPFGLAVLVLCAMQVGWAGVGNDAPLRCWWHLPLLAGAGALLAAQIDGGGLARLQRSVGAALAATLALTLGGFVIASLLRIVAFAVDHSNPHAVPAMPGNAAAAPLASGILFLQLAFPFLLRGLYWANETMRRARVGNLARLQWCWRPAAVQALFTGWSRRLQLRDDALGRAAAAAGAADLARAALWRSTLGVVPLHALVLGFGSWFAADSLHWSWLGESVGGMPRWFLFVLVAALAHLGKNALQLQWLRCLGAGRDPGAVVVRAAAACTIAMWVALLVTTGSSLAVIPCASVELALQQEREGWRGTAALLLWIPGVIGVVTVGAAWARKPRVRS